MADSLGHDIRRDDAAAWSACEIARLHREIGGRPLSPVMKTAATARELARNAADRRDH